MSKRVVAAVFDSAVQAYGQPIFVATTAAGVRSFIDEVKRGGENNMLAAHPSDFELHQLAVFDDESGAFENMVPVSLIRGKDVV